MYDSTFLYLPFQARDDNRTGHGATSSASATGKALASLNGHKEKDKDKDGKKRVGGIPPTLFFPSLSLSFSLCPFRDANAFPVAEAELVAP